MPIVSIIVPVYNTEKYLRPCLESIQAQTFKDFEAILVDDGSTDKSGDICDEYAVADSRFVVVHKKNEGVAKARITAFEHSKGDYITFIDADDYVDERYVGHLYECIERNNADVSCCQYFRVGDRGAKLSIRSSFGFYNKEGIKKVLIPGLGWNPRIGKESFPPFLCTKMIKKCFVRQILDAGHGLWYGEDQCGTLRLMYLINSFYNSEEPLYYYVSHDGQATATLSRKRWDAYVAFWSRMEDEDIKKIWITTAPYKFLEHLRRYLDSCYSKEKTRYSSFKEEALYALNSSFLDKHLFNKELEGLSKKEKFYFFLLKNKYTFIYYYIRKIRSYIR